MDVVDIAVAGFDMESSVSSKLNASSRNASSAAYLYGRGRFVFCTPLPLGFRFHFDNLSVLCCNFHEEFSITPSLLLAQRNSKHVCHVITLRLMMVKKSNGVNF